MDYHSKKKKKKKKKLDAAKTKKTLLHLNNALS